MKIGIIVGDISLKNGTERAVVNLANLLIEKYEIEILTLNFKNKKIGFELNKNIKIKELKLPIIDSTLKKIMYFLKLLGVFFKIKRKYTYIIGTNPMINNMGCLSLKNFIACEHMNNEASSKLSDFLKKILYQKAKKVILLTKRDESYYKKFLKNTMVIPNLIPKNSSKSSLDKKKLLSIGRFTHQKGFDTLLIIFKKILEKNNDWNLRIVGEGEEKKQLQEFIKENKMEKNVELINFKDNIEEEYLSSSIYLMTSRWEGLPMVLLEALNYGLPIVSFDCPYGPSDIIYPGENGYLIENQNIDIFVEKLLILMNNNIKIREMGLKSKEKVKEYYSEEILLKWENVLERKENDI